MCESMRKEEQLWGGIHKSLVSEGKIVMVIEMV